MCYAAYTPYAATTIITGMVHFQKSSLKYKSVASGQLWSSCNATIHHKRVTILGSSVARANTIHCHKDFSDMSSALNAIAVLIALETR